MKTIHIFRKITFLIMLMSLVIGGCAFVHDAPQSNSTYESANYEGQLPQSTNQELEEKYPEGFWREKELNIPREGRVKIGIKEFGNSTTRRDFGKSITEAFLTVFTKSEAFTIIERQQLDKVVNEFELNQSGLIDASTAKEVGHILGIDIIVTGCASEAGKSQRIDARAIDISTGEIVVAEKINQAYDSHKINLLAGRLVNRLIEKYYNK